MYINSMGYFIPTNRLDNKYFADLSGKDENWYVKRTGIHTRARASSHETINYMAIEATRDAIKTLPYNIQEIDLIIFASYTPSDTIATTGHYIQNEFNIEKTKVLYISSACSSAINAFEIVQSFFQSGIASKALVICADRNSTYTNDQDSQAGHLWGDAAVAVFFSKEKYQDSDLKLIDIETEGLASTGKNVEGVKLNLQNAKLEMPHGQDVFIHACTHMHDNILSILNKNNFNIDNLNYLIGHQANMRIVSHIVNQLNIPESKSLNNVDKYGNTGCAGAILVLAENFNKFKSGDIIGITVFGGGYSSGACLFQKC